MDRFGPCFLDRVRAVQEPIHVQRFPILDVCLRLVRLHCLAVELDTLKINEEANQKSPKRAHLKLNLQHWRKIDQRNLHPGLLPFKFDDVVKIRSKAVINVDPVVRYVDWKM